MTGLLRSRALGVLLLAAVLLGKALVPAGWMPVQTAQGIAVLICSGNGPAQALLDASGHLAPARAGADSHGKDGPGPGNHGQSEDPCPYAALAMASQLPAAPPPAPQAPFAAALPHFQPPAAIGQGLAAPPPPATGPPASA